MCVCGGERGGRERCSGRRGREGVPEEGVFREGGVLEGEGECSREGRGGEERGVREGRGGGVFGEVWCSGRRGVFGGVGLFQLQLYVFLTSWPPKGGWNGGGNWHNGGCYGSKNSYSSCWKWKGSSKGYRGWQTPWNSQQSSGSWQEPHRTQWTTPPLASPPGWFSTSFASTVESAFVGAIRELTDRTTSSWVSRALYAYQCRAPCCDGLEWRPNDIGTNDRHPGPCQRWEHPGEAYGRDAKKKPELPEGDARVRRKLIDELKKETASTRRTCNEKVKRTRGCSFGMTDRPSHLAEKKT